jgi:hypothetical protein
MRKRFRPSHATVVAYLALFVALGGTALAATYVVSSNSQIGPGTVSGHAGTAANKNIIAGSVNGQDVADNSVHTADITNNDIRSGDVRDDNYAGGGLQSSDIADNSLTGVDIEDATLNGVARKLIYDETASPAPAPKTTLVTLGAYTLKASCEVSPPHYLNVFVNGPGGTFNESAIWSVDDQYSNVHPYQDGKSLTAFTDDRVSHLLGATRGDYDRYASTFFLQSGGLLVRVDYNAVIDSRTSTDYCHLYGTATFGT